MKGPHLNPQFSAYFDIYFENHIDEIVSTFNPNQVGGGQICPPVGKTLYTSGTKSPIDLKPGYKFEFGRCL